MFFTYFKVIISIFSMFFYLHILLTFIAKNMQVTLHAQNSLIYINPFEGWI